MQCSKTFLLGGDGHIFTEFVYFQELPEPEHPCFIKCSCLPVNQTGLPHGQVSHNNHFRDFKPDKRRKSRN